MATNKKYQKKKIQDTENSGFGQYSEGVGGGASPNDASQGEHGHGANSDYRKENNDTMQARTADGKFTYKSVNGKSIDPKYGPSRGKTVNPLLTGGKNGVKIEDVEKEFASQSGNYWSQYKDKWYVKGSLVVTSDMKTRVAAKSIWDVAKEVYNEKLQEFGGVISTEHKFAVGNGSKGISGQGGLAESSVFDETKKGAPSKEIKAAKQKVQATGEEAPVIDQSTGGMKLKPGVTFTPSPVKPKPVPTSAPKQTPVVPATPTQTQPSAPQPSATASVSTSAPKDLSGVKYSAEQVNKVQDFFKNKFKDDAKLPQLLSKLGSLSPEQLDKQIDVWVSKGIDFGFGDSNQSNANSSNSSQPSASKEVESEDNPTIKKIKAMGFDGK